MSAEDAVCSLAGAPSSWCAAQTTAAVPRTQGVKGTRRNFKVTTAHAPTTSAAHGSFEDKVDAAHGASSCSRGGDDAVSCVASSIHMTVGGAPEEAVTATPLAAQSELADEAAAVQRIVFEESVDTAAVVTPAELQRMRVEAAVGGAQPGALGKLPTPYETRLITAEVLRDWTGWEDLDLVYSTQLRVDADMMIGVDQIGAQLPRLASLKLNCSRIPRVRQLGTGYHELKYLWLNSCHVTDLGGIAACCPSLVELYLPFNHVCDLAPVMALCETLEVLDVEGNLLDDIADLRSVLSSLRKVRSLSLVGNPLTYQHQARVREAYRDLLAEEGRGAGESTATTGGIDSPVLLLAEQRPFSHVLAAFVRLLMPQLQTLDDVDIDAIIAANPFAPSPVPGSPSEVANQRRTAPFSVHVDPLSDGLAEELRLVEECIRNTDAFDPLLAAVDEANRRVYTRPSTSGSGARPRHAPRTAMGLARPSTSQWRGAPTRLCSWGVSTMEASTLTTGATLAGNATASLRRRLPESTTEALDEAHDTPSPTVPSTGNGDGSTRLNGFSHRDHSCCSASAITTPTSALGGGARIAALLADDSEEEEWEHFKSSLLRSQSAATPSYSKFLHSQYEETGEAADTQQTDDFDKELRMELTRLRMRIAKEHRE
ncbi:hypothetical protein JKF63_05773 [Porcisia hertigi]|uniref:Leucine-rich repeat-containing protein 56 n=1 Tax=Porcisia hertigi TaxID=2761500 RepID=A0A836HWE6_9TRYP|nr:hypothetical protein JKF63_05773 [Porcisia hertigi]